MDKKTRILIVDDSALIREFLRETFEADPDLTVVGAAADPFFAREKVVKLHPDVITLDVEMPRMDGLTFLGKLMAARPTPVVMFSSHTAAGAKATMEALALGAVDFVAKPKSNLAATLPSLREELIEKVRAAGGVKATKLRPQSPQPAAPPPLVSSTVRGLARQKKKSGDRLVAIGASTGGTVAIEAVLAALPADVPPTAVVQHMPPHFTKAFADRLNGKCRMEIQEAASGQRLEEGLVLIAPGGLQMLLQRDRRGYFVEVKDAPPVNRHKPSVDVLFRSAAHSAGPKALGIIMTGMGADGAQGLLEMKKAGAETVAQDEATSIVYGMPREAAALGAVDHILPLQKIPRTIEEYSH